MRKQNHYLDEIIGNGTFRFAELAIRDIDNSQVYECFGKGIADQETCLFHRDIATGDDYLARFHEDLAKAVSLRQALPVVRFADGEYAFYNDNLDCNGLYKQAESVDAIRGIMAAHVEALRTLADQGCLAPLVFPGNAGGKRAGFLSFLAGRKKESSAGTFLDFISSQGIALTGDNYTPFYVVYAGLTSAAFARIVDGKKIAILNSEYDRDACLQWFDGRSSRPDIAFVEIPDEYVATRWPSIRADILKQVPQDTALCLVGAGAGALLVCVDVSRHLSIPAIDAGHVLNMMNNRIDKSNGLRLYTLREKPDAR